MCPVWAPQRWEGGRKETLIWEQEWFPTGLCKEASALKQLLCARNCAKQFHVNFLYNIIALAKAFCFLMLVLTKLLIVRHKARPIPDSRSFHCTIPPPKVPFSFQHYFNLLQEWGSKAMWHIRIYFAFKRRFALNAVFKLIIYKWDYIWKTSSKPFNGIQW